MIVFCIRGGIFLLNQMKFAGIHIFKKYLSKVGPEFLNPLKQTIVVKTSRRETEVEKGA